MKQKVLIAPSLLACNVLKLGEEIEKVEKAGADVLHLDIMDGHFVPNLTFGIPICEAIRKITKLPIDAHLMIANADLYIEKYIKAGASWVSIHAEAIADLKQSLQKIRSLGAKAGVALNPATPISKIENVLDNLDYILIMSVNPGFGGQGFIESTLDKVQKLKTLLQNRNILIEMDGGIKTENSKRLIEAGVDVLVVGTGLFGKPDYGRTITELRG